MLKTLFRRKSDGFERNSGKSFKSLPATKNSTDIAFNYDQNGNRVPNIFQKESIFGRIGRKISFKSSLNPRTETAETFTEPSLRQPSSFIKSSGRSVDINGNIIQARSSHLGRERIVTRIPSEAGRDDRFSTVEEAAAYQYQYEKKQKNLDPMIRESVNRGVDLEDAVEAADEPEVDRKIQREPSTRAGGYGYYSYGYETISSSDSSSSSDDSSGKSDGSEGCPRPRLAAAVMGIKPAQANVFPAPVCCKLVDPNAEEGLNFQFPQTTDRAVLIEFSVEPKKKPQWQTLIDCGFAPVINCPVPPGCVTNDCPCVVDKCPCNSSDEYYDSDDYLEDENESQSESSAQTGSTRTRNDNDDDVFDETADEENEDSDDNVPPPRRRSPTEKELEDDLDDGDKDDRDVKNKNKNKK